MIFFALYTATLIKCSSGLAGGKLALESRNSETDPCNESCNYDFKSYEYNEPHGRTQYLDYPTVDDGDPEGDTKYADKDLKCFACQNGKTDEACDKHRVVTCQNSRALLNWDHIKYSNLNRFACAFLRYSEGGKDRVMKGCVTIPNKDYHLCDRIQEIYKTAQFTKCGYCYKHKCNAYSGQSKLFKLKQTVAVCFLLGTMVVFFHMY